MDIIDGVIKKKNQNFGQKWTFLAQIFLGKFILFFRQATVNESGVLRKLGAGSTHRFGPLLHADDVYILIESCEKFPHLVDQEIEGRKKRAKIKSKRHRKFDKPPSSADTVEQINSKSEPLDRVKPETDVPPDSPSSKSSLRPRRNGINEENDILMQRLQEDIQPTKETFRNQRRKRRKKKNAKLKQRPVSNEQSVTIIPPDSDVKQNDSPESIIEYHNDFVNDSSAPLSPENASGDTPEIDAQDSPSEIVAPDTDLTDSTPAKSPEPIEKKMKVKENDADSKALECDEIDNQRPIETVKPDDYKTSEVKLDQPNDVSVESPSDETQSAVSSAMEKPPERIDKLDDTPVKKTRAVRVNKRIVNYADDIVNDFKIQKVKIFPSKDPGVTATAPTESLDVSPKPSVDQDNTTSEQCQTVPLNQAENSSEADVLPTKKTRTRKRIVNYAEDIVRIENIDPKELKAIHKVIGIPSVDTAVNPVKPVESLPLVEESNVENIPMESTLEQSSASVFNPTENSADDLPETEKPKHFNSSNEDLNNTDTSDETTANVKQDESLLPVTEQTVETPDPFEFSTESASVFPNPRDITDNIPECINETDVTPTKKRRASRVKKRIVNYTEDSDPKHCNTSKEDVSDMNTPSDTPVNVLDESISSITEQTVEKTELPIKSDMVKSPEYVDETDHTPTKKRRASRVKKRIVNYDEHINSSPEEIAIKVIKSVKSTILITNQTGKNTDKIEEKLVASASGLPSNLPSAIGTTDKTPEDIEKTDATPTNKRRASRVKKRIVSYVEDIDFNTSPESVSDRSISSEGTVTLIKTAESTVTKTAESPVKIDELASEPASVLPSVDTTEKTPERSDKTTPTKKRRASRVKRRIVNYTEDDLKFTKLSEGDKSTKATPSKETVENTVKPVELIPVVVKPSIEIHSQSGPIPAESPLVKLAPVLPMYPAKTQKPVEKTSGKLPVKKKRNRSKKRVKNNAQDVVLKTSQMPLQSKLQKVVPEKTVETLKHEDSILSSEEPSLKTDQFESPLQPSAPVLPSGSPDKTPGSTDKSGGPLTKKTRAIRAKKRIETDDTSTTSDTNAKQVETSIQTLPTSVQKKKPVKRKKSPQKRNRKSKSPKVAKTPKTEGISTPILSVTKTEHTNANQQSDNLPTSSDCQGTVPVLPKMEPEIGPKPKIESPPNPENVTPPKPANPTSPKSGNESPKKERSRPRRVRNSIMKPPSMTISRNGKINFSINSSFKYKSIILFDLLFFEISKPSILIKFSCINYFFHPKILLNKDSMIAEKIVG